jgi:Lon protease-like protein
MVRAVAWQAMELPLFPLHVVLFPGRPLPLHLFEPRYRRMLADCLAGDRRFGVVAIRAGVEVGGGAEVFSVGTVARVESVKELPDGRFDIVTRGEQRFRVSRFLPESPYLRAEVDLLDEGPCSDRDRAAARQLRSLLLLYLAGLGAPEELLERVPVDPDELAWLAAAAVQVEVPEQQRLLELDSTGSRLETASALLRREAGLMRHFGTVGSLRPPGPNGSDLN